LSLFSPRRPIAVKTVVGCCIILIPPKSFRHPSSHFGDRLPREKGGKSWYYISPEAFLKGPKRAELGCMENDLRRVTAMQQ
jgi:hypothetical protein